MKNTVVAPSLGTMGRLGIAKLSHLLLEVADLQRSIDFYIGFLGFEVREEGTLADGRPYVATIQGLGLTKISTISAAGQAFNHIAFRCPGGIDDLIQALEDAGLPYEEPRRTPYGLSIYVRDPDGYRVECHDSTGYDGDASSASDS